MSTGSVVKIGSVCGVFGLCGEGREADDRVVGVVSDGALRRSGQVRTLV